MGGNSSSKYKVQPKKEEQTSGKRNGLLVRSASVIYPRDWRADREVQLLLIGKGESGKSTIGRQMRLIYGGPLTTPEKLHFRRVVHANALLSLKDLLAAMQLERISFADERRVEDRRQFYLHTDRDDVITPELAEWMERLWQDAGTQKCFQEKLSDCMISDSAAYFLDALKRIARKDYLPSTDDILRARLKRTDDNMETRFLYGGLAFRMTELSELRQSNWLPLFREMDAMLLCVSLTGYAIGTEDQNRMQSSLQLFRLFVESGWFSAPIFLFLNKKDLFEQKLKHTPLSHCFPEYRGSNSLDECIAYIRQAFESLVPMGEDEQPRIAVQTIATCAISAEDVSREFKPIAAAMLVKKSAEKPSLKELKQKIREKKALEQKADHGEKKESKCKTKKKDAA